MNPRLTDMLACPADGAVPLVLHVLQTEGAGDVAEGMLRCPVCATVYPILNGIPHLVRPGLRHIGRERESFDNPSRSITAPPEWLESLRTAWRSASAGQTDGDRRLLQEGAYWSEFFRIHYEIGALTIFDARRKGLHPSYWPHGLRITDDRDRWRAHAAWPNPLGRRMLRFFEETRAADAETYLDLGCGGGQFGLEAAWRGATLVGIDIAVGALELGREYALKNGLDARYVYAELDWPPFVPGTFDALVVKDALHHLPDPRHVLRLAARAMRPGGEVMLIEHTADKPRWEALKQKILERFGDAILRRYPRGEAPEIFQRLSPMEDAGMPELESILTGEIDIAERRGELLYASEYALPVYLAAGRRRFPAELLSALGYRFERLALLWGKPRFVFIRGRMRK